MYANLEGNITFNNVFEDSTNLLSKEYISYELSFICYGSSFFECLD